MTTEVICFLLCHSLERLSANHLLCAMVVWLLFNSPVLVCGPPPCFPFQSKWTAHQVTHIPFCVARMPALLCGMFFIAYLFTNSQSLFKTQMRCQLSSSLPFSPTHCCHICGAVILFSLCYFRCWTKVSFGYMLVIQEIFIAELWFQWVLLELCAFQDKNWRTSEWVAEEPKNQDK